MVFKSLIRSSIVAAGITLGLSAAPAQADVVGSVVLNISASCFSYDTTGSNRCNNTTGDGIVEYAEGTFEFSNNIFGTINPADYAYEASINIVANLGILIGNQTYNQAESFATYTDLTNYPLWDPARDLAFAALADPNPGDPYGIVIPTTPSVTIPVQWNYILSELITSGTIPTAGSGTFEAWSSADLQPLLTTQFSDEIGSNIARVESFNAEIRLNAILPSSTTPVPEPATLALISLGILGIGAANRRRKMQNV